MTRTEFVNEVFKKLEENHLFLYHDITKEEFEKHKQKFLKNVDSLDELHFEAGMFKLFALFKDAHTMYKGFDLESIGVPVYNIKNDFYIYDDSVKKFKKIKKVNGFDIKLVIKKMKQLISFEVKTWANFKIEMGLLCSPKMLKMIDCGKSEKRIEFICENGDKVVLDSVKTNSLYKRKPLYESAKKCDNEILYIRYRACKNMENYSFEQFVNDIKKEWETPPKACLIDVRFNSGGSSDVIQPLKKFLIENNVKTYLLMNRGTFSGGTFALTEFKKELGATLMGTNAGQPTKRFGNCVPLSVDGKKFTASESYFVFTSDKSRKDVVKPSHVIDVFDYDGVIKPDIVIEENIDDLNNLIDTQLEKSLKIIKKEIIRNSSNKKERILNDR